MLPFLLATSFSNKNLSAYSHHPFSAEEIKALREREEVSQRVFAHYLNVTKESVSQWERGQKKPAGTTLKLLSLVERRGISAIA